MRLKEFAVPSDKFLAKIKAMDVDALTELRDALTVRQERQRMKFARTRSSADSEAYRKTGAELGRVKTELTLRK